MPTKSELEERVRELDELLTASADQRWELEKLVDHFLDQKEVEQRFTDLRDRIIDSLSEVSAGKTLLAEAASQLADDMAELAEHRNRGPQGGKARARVYAQAGDLFQSCLEQEYQRGNYFFSKGEIVKEKAELQAAAYEIYLDSRKAPLPEELSYGWQRGLLNAWLKSSGTHR